MIYFIPLVVLILVLFSGVLIRRLLQHSYLSPAAARRPGAPEQAGRDVTPKLARSDTHPPAYQPSEPVDTDNNLWQTQYLKPTLIGLAILIPVCAISLYLLTGSPQHLDSATQTAANSPRPGVKDLTVELVAHLDANPNNPEGWFILGRTYLKLGRYNAAVRALTTAHEQNSVATTKVALADALTLQNQGEIPDLAVVLLEQALALAPDSVTTLWMLGQAAQQRDHVVQARDYWQRALPLLQTQPEAQAALRTQLDGLADRP